MKRPDMMKLKYFSPLAVLLKYEGYPPAVLFALALHVGLLWFIVDRAMARQDFVELDQPVTIAASVIQENPQRLRRLEQLQAQRDAQEREAAEQRRREEAAARARAEEQARQQAQREQQERERAEAERQRQLADQRAREQAQRRAEEEAARERERQQQLAREQAARAEAERQAAAQRAAEQAAAVEAGVVGKYVAIIRNTIERNWQIPPSACNGLTVGVRVNLVPTGEVVNVSVIQRSGDAVFDRSAVQAVERADRFPELLELDPNIFNRNFRTVELIFRPADLLRYCN